MDDTSDNPSLASASTSTPISPPTRETMYSLNPNPKLHSSVMPAVVYTGSEDGLTGNGSDEATTEAIPPPFGSRFLTADKDVWSKNAWDHVPPPEGHDEAIQKALNRQRLAPVKEKEKEKYNARPARYWDQFYQWNEANFFKDRKWLHNEFPELVLASARDAPPMRIVEVGCGTGATTFPLLGINENPELEIFSTDFSSKAIEVVRANPMFSDPPVGKVHASVWDLSSSSLPEGVEPGSADIIVMIFVLSALHPTEWTRAASNIYKMLKPGGMLLMRDYGRYDLAQLRFKEDRLLEDHLYTDFWCRYPDEISMLFTGSARVQRSTSPTSFAEQATVVYEDEEEQASTPKDDISSQSADIRDQTPVVSTTMQTMVGPGSAEAPDPECARWIPLDVPFPDCPNHPLFSIEQLGVDRRLIVNRKRQLKMYRVWIQGKFQKRDSLPSAQVASQ
ncbi:hypothetical protein FRC16_000953 [Serendipita sp. 398]|nr:hypothetical protein FRC16_000953 [Serendipita sp. 398]